MLSPSRKIKSVLSAGVLTTIQRLWCCNVDSSTRHQSPNPPSWLKQHSKNADFTVVFMCCWSELLITNLIYFYDLSSNFIVRGVPSTILMNTNIWYINYHIKNARYDCAKRTRNKIWWYVTEADDDTSQRQMRMVSIINISTLEFHFLWQQNIVVVCTYNSDPWLEMQTGRFQVRTYWFQFQNLLPNLISELVQVSTWNWVCGFDSECEKNWKFRFWFRNQFRLVFG